jgi:TcpE family
VELPTYTNIWKIEKRLYKLYDFRLPMPLPIGLVAAFLAIAIPYMLVLTLVGMPFSHTWVWLYVLPPGALAWLVTRPVLEGKRLPELVLSQVRYLAEPRVWCRLAPLAERDEITVVTRVWRRASAPTGIATAGGIAPVPVADAARAGEAARAPLPGAVLTRPAWPDQPAVGRPSRGARAAAAHRFEPAPATHARTAAPAEATPAPVRVQVTATGRAGPARNAADPAERASAPEPSARSAPPARPALTVRADGLAGQPLHVVERALRTPLGGRADGWRDRVVVVPGGHRPGKPDQVQRDQARARTPLTGPARIVILGTTAGAGQTVTTLLAGQLLATLRGEAVAVLDLGSEADSGALTQLARQMPRLLPSRRLAASAALASEAGVSRDRGLQVVTAYPDAAEPRDAGQLIDAVAARFPLLLADPAAVHVPHALTVADQLVLVTPAGRDAAGSLAMTLEWLEAHGHARLAGAAVTVLNGVGEQTAQDADRAATVAAGRCRAIVRVPWDGGLAGGGTLGSVTVRAYTGLAGVLVSGLRTTLPAGAERAGSASR